MTDLLMASNLFNGLFVFVLGMLVVFFGIALIVLVISAIGKIMSAKKAKNEQKPQEDSVTEVVKETSDELSSETVAVITAALTAYYYNNASSCEFKIKKIKRIY